MNDWVVGADLGATKIALGLIDPDGHIVARRRLPTGAHDRAEAIVARIAEGVAALADGLSPDSPVAAMGICTPGPIDREAGIVVDPPNVPGLHHTPLRQMLADRLGMPVSLEHDAKAAALGEFHFGAGRGETSMVYIVVGTGVGAAYILNGQVYRGTHNAAGEIGHITLDRQGEPCSCGSRGCVETFMSGPWLARRYERALTARGEASDRQPVTGEMVGRLAQEGDPLALEIVTQAGEALGVAVATVAMILDVELYVIGSSVAQCRDLLLEPARRMAPRYSHQSVGKRIRIVTTELWDDGPILGTGWQARQLAQST